MQKIVVASDSFKGSLSSSQVADAAEKGIRAVFPDCNVVKVNVAEGAAYVFAPQKGASSEMVRVLDEGMFHFAGVLKRTLGGADIAPMPGAGAAGGLGGGFQAFLGARLVKGIEMVLDAISFDETIRGADLVITGEGMVDSQTACGKTAAGVLGRAKAQGIPVIAMGGCVVHCPELDNMGFAAIRAVSDPEAPLEWSMRPDVASASITRAVEYLFRK